MDLGDHEHRNTSPMNFEGYNQTYIVGKRTVDGDQRRKAMFRCGKWCYVGHIDLTDIELENRVPLKNVPVAISKLQNQQEKLKYAGVATRMAASSFFYLPSKSIYSAQDFVASELSKDYIERELKKWSSIFPWILDDDQSRCKSKVSNYFELKGNLGSRMCGIEFAASKTYSRGLILITLYSEGSFYVVLQDGEGDQPLLDLRFPDISSHGQGVILRTYSDPSEPWGKLTLWHCLGTKVNIIEPKKEISPRCRSASFSSSKHIQTYFIAKHKSEKSNIHHSNRDVFFRFGSWCYAGKASLIPEISISDLNYVLPALRLQQHLLQYKYDINFVPENCSYFRGLEYFNKILPILIDEVIDSESILEGLFQNMEELSTNNNISDWLDGENHQIFFEFNVSDKEESATILEDVDIIACRCYTAEGVVFLIIWHCGTFYVTLTDGAAEQPLLDSTFPSPGGHNVGYQVKYLPVGRKDWPSLRKITIWQVSKYENADDDLMESCAIRGGKKNSDPEEQTEKLNFSPYSASNCESMTLQEEKESGEYNIKMNSGEIPLMKNGVEVKLLANDNTKCARRNTETCSFKSSASANGGEEFEKNKVSGDEPKFKAAIPLMKTRVTLPHHLKPLTKSDLARKVEELERDYNPAWSCVPWDHRGRPRK